MARLPLINSEKPTAKIRMEVRYATLAPICAGIELRRPSFKPRLSSSKVMGPGLKVTVAHNNRKKRNEERVSAVVMALDLGKTARKWPDGRQSRAAALHKAGKVVPNPALLHR